MLQRLISKDIQLVARLASKLNHIKADLDLDLPVSSEIVQITFISSPPCYRTQVKQTERRD